MHYICTGGCKGVSEEPGTCQAVDCPKHGEPLQECSCTDDTHHGAFEAKPEHSHAHEEDIPLNRT